MSPVDVLLLSPDGSTETISVERGWSDRTSVGGTLPGDYVFRLPEGSAEEVLLVRHPAPTPLAPLEGGGDLYALPEAKANFAWTLVWRDAEGSSELQMVDFGQTPGPGQWAEVETPEGAACHVPYPYGGEPTAGTVQAVYSTYVKPGKQ